MKKSVKSFIFIFLVLCRISINAMDLNTDVSFWVPTLQRSDLINERISSSENIQNSGSSGASTALSILGTAGALRMLTSLTAVNTVMHGYVIAKLNALGNKVNNIGTRLSELTNTVKINHGENIAAHMRSKEAIDNVKHLNEQLQKNFKEHHEITFTRFDNLEESLKKVGSQLKQNDKRNGTRSRRTARIVMRNQQENFNRLIVENKDLKNIISRISENQIKLSENQIGLTEALEKFSPTHAKWAESALWILRRVKH